MLYVACVITVAVEKGTFIWGKEESKITFTKFFSFTLSILNLV